jgi:NhaP-type Na+/H+ or K+/H+ antiporter
MIILNTLLGGFLLGIFFGYIAHTFFCWTDDKYARVLISFLVSFGVYWFSELVGASSIIATVTAGLIINYRIHKLGGMGRESNEMLEALWEFVGFIVSSIAFIFIGMNIEIQVLVANYPLIICVFLYLMLMRHLIVVCLAEVMKRLGGEELPQSWRLCFSWAGLRGAVSAVLALGLSKFSMPHSEMIIVLTFGVVLVSNLVQGLSISNLIKRYGIFQKNENNERESDSQWMRDGYNPLGFNSECSIIEKALFTAPEYFIFDTRFGNCVVLKLEAIQLRINNYLEKNLPNTSGGILRNFLVMLTYFSSLLSNRIFQIRKKYYMNLVYTEKDDLSIYFEAKNWFSKNEIKRRSQISMEKD